MKRRAFTLIELLVVISIIALLIGILLPALGAARTVARQLQNGTQVRGLHQGMVSWAQENKGFFPGVNSQGHQVQSNELRRGRNFIFDGTSNRGRMLLLIDRGFAPPEYLLNPADKTRVPYNPASVSGPTLGNLSYAPLQLQFQAPGGSSPLSRFPRFAEWSLTTNPEAPIMADRAVNLQGGQINTSVSAGNFGSVWSNDPTVWRGSVVYNDNHVVFEDTALLDTKMGDGPRLFGDNIFAPGVAQDGVTADRGPAPTQAGVFLQFF